MIIVSIAKVTSSVTVWPYNLDLEAATLGFAGIVKDFVDFGANLQKIGFIWRHADSALF